MAALPAMYPTVHGCTRSKMSIRPACPSCMSFDTTHVGNMHRLGDHGVDGICQWSPGSPADAFDAFGRQGPVSRTGTPTSVRFVVLDDAFDLNLAPGHARSRLVDEVSTASSAPSRCVSATAANVPVSGSRIPTLILVGSSARTADPSEDATNGKRRGQSGTAFSLSPPFNLLSPRQPGDFIFCMRCTTSSSVSRIRMADSATCSH